MEKTGVKLWLLKLIQKMCNLLLFSFENATASIHVCAEINAALNCEKKIITVRFDDSKYTLDLEMYLRSLHMLNFSDVGFDEKLIEAIEPSSFV